MVFVGSIENPKNKTRTANPYSSQTWRHPKPAATPKIDLEMSRTEFPWQLGPLIVVAKCYRVEIFAPKKRFIFKLNIFRSITFVLIFCFEFSLEHLSFLTKERKKFTCVSASAKEYENF